MKSRKTGIILITAIVLLWIISIYTFSGFATLAMIVLIAVFLVWLLKDQV
jgi:hypothetical protein